LELGLLGLDLREIMEDAAVAEVVLKLFELGAIKLGKDLY